MRFRKLSIIFLLIFTFTTPTACQSPSDQEKPKENDPIISLEPEQPENKGSSEGLANPADPDSPTRSANVEPGQHSDAAAEPDKEDTVDVDTTKEPVLDIKVIESHFEGEEGAFVLKAINDDQSVVFNEKLAVTAFPPCSTFKIPNALIGLELGVVQDKDALKKWDGTIYRITDWNRDHTLESAVKYSALWYFKEIARGIGTDNMQKYVDAMSYGNRDISGGIDLFWLDSSLLITPYQQVEFLEKLYKEELPFRQENIRMVKEMIIQDSLEGGTFSGKTGTGDHGGWFVGYFETPGDVYLFSAFMKNKQGREVKETVIDILNEIK